MSDAMAAADTASKAAGYSLSFINFNLATEYLTELGFYVAVDGAMRLARPLPAACIISTSPPGSMYQVGGAPASVCHPVPLSLPHTQDHMLVDDVC
jgi:hypothetical protein